MSYCKNCGDDVPSGRAGVTVHDYGCVVCFSDACVEWASQFAPPRPVLVPTHKQGATAVPQSYARAALKQTNKYSNTWRD